MRILMLGINYAPEIISIAVYSTGLAEQLAADGHDVEVVTALPYFPGWRVFDDWRGWRWRKEASGDRLRITHCPLYVPANPTGARRILHHASFALSALPVMLAAALRRKPDMVFVVAPSMVAAPIGLMAARLAGARTWLHIQDYEVDAAFATRLIAEDSRIGRTAKAFESWVLRRFDRISSISPQMVAKLLAKNVPEARCHELRNWADLSRITPLSATSPLRETLGITTPHVALYSGNLANKQGLEILPAMARALLHRKDLTFVICGDGPMRAALVEMSKDLDNIRFFPLQPVEQLSNLLGMADVHLLPQIKGAADLMLPSKMANMLASGRPILATAERHTALGAEVEGAGILVEPGDFDAAAAALESLLDDPTLRACLGTEGRRRAQARWDIEGVLRPLQDAFHAVLQS